MTLKQAWSLRDKVAFYPSQFETGLRLPIDPFSVELMERTNAVSVELLINATSLIEILEFSANCSPASLLLYPLGDKW